MSDMVK